jgi:hydroxymethylglutaryl-CoA lyase/(R)-citramalyl-CoA lyase
VAEEVVEVNSDEVVLAETIGVAGSRFRRGKLVGGVTVGRHCYDTRNTGLANAVAAVESRPSWRPPRAGLAAAPLAPRAIGNIATEDLMYLLHGMGHVTGVDLEALIDVATWLSERLEKNPPGEAYKVGNFA